MTFVIGPDSPPFIIAELSGNHNGDVSRAFDLIDAAKQAGANAVKFQTYTADTMTIQHSGPGFDITEGPWAGRNLYELYQEAATPWEWHEPLFEHARGIGLVPFSTPFDETAVDFLEQLHPEMYKIASFELTDEALIRRVAATGKPMIISTGMGTVEEVIEAYGWAGGNAALLHCISGYPTPSNEANLQRIKVLQGITPLVGLSDHSMTPVVPIAATALGAVIFEKHLCLSRADGGPDAAFSLEPGEFMMMAAVIREAWAAIQYTPDNHGPQPSEAVSITHRRSLYVVENIKAGELITRENVRAIRPGYGAAPKNLEAALGCVAAKDLPRGTPLNLADLSDRPVS